MSLALSNFIHAFFRNLLHIKSGLFCNNNRARITYCKYHQPALLSYGPFFQQQDFVLNAQSRYDTTLIWERKSIIRQNTRHKRFNVNTVIAKFRAFSFLFLFNVLLMMGITITMTSCALGPRPMEPVALTLHISANAQINPDINGRPSPVAVRIYELKSVALFSSADFFSLFDKDTATLGGDLLGKEEFTLYPGETRILTRPGHLETTAIGVLVAYRDLEKSIWRTTHAVSPASEVSYFSGIPVVSGMLKPEEAYNINIDAQQVFISP